MGELFQRRRPRYYGIERNHGQDMYNMQGLSNIIQWANDKLKKMFLTNVTKVDLATEIV